MSLEVETPIDALLDLMRRLPPQHVQQNLDKLVQLAPEDAEELVSSVDVPLRIVKCKETGKPYLCCDYNKDGNSYRSPHSNEYDPPLPEGAFPSVKLRKLEVSANEAFDTYREMYFEGGVSSVYLWDTDPGAFAGVVLFKKRACPQSHFSDLLDQPSTDSWDSIHVFEALEKGRMANYKLTSTVMLTISVSGPSEGTVSLSGSMTRQQEQDLPIASIQTHIANTGRMIEDMELKMRNQLQDVYFGKTRDVVGELRSVVGDEEERRRRDLAKELQGRFGKRLT
ncbi:putative F-actin capping protein beta subunit [Calocera viscosa TUFC12733]|uniref:F-actin-capping protein subunit beta n=1 Tax=Calocera viscosa (strain TUFC12733) TaxID=1330018 RepID=A0A167GL46_CALVF|nr:putative F-actin capping protein beta subunit [Calocera viscosa TUFC12733]